MTIIQAIILGVVQGITEFLPISSSGHLVLIPEIFGWDLQPTSFDIMMHAATLGAILVYFKKDLLTLFVKIKQRNYTLFFNILIATVPALIIGMLFTDLIDSTFKSSITIVFMLISVGIVMLFIEPLSDHLNHHELESLPYFKAFIIGIFQSLAFIRGTSRSGITIIGGLATGLKMKDAARYAFLIGIPIIAAAAGKQLLDLDISEVKDIGIINLGVGSLSAFISGVISIKFLLKFLENRGLAIFGIYRIILGILLLVFFV